MLMKRIITNCIILLCLVLPARLAMAQESDLEEVTITQLKQILQENDATLTVVNFWATWCAP